MRVEKFIDNIRKIHLQVQETIQNSYEKYKAKHDQHKIENSFMVGVGLRGPNLGSELFTPTNKTITIGPFNNNLHSAGFSLSQRSIGGC